MTSIVLTADQNYLRFVPTLLTQISRFGRRADGVILAVPARMTEDHLSRVDAAARIHDVSLTVIRVQEADQQQIERYAPIGAGLHASHFTYTRLLLPDMLPDLDHVLYLDVDTMIRAPIDELLEWDLSHPLGAVQELAGTAAHLFGTPRVPYFNAGVLRMSLKRLRQEHLWERSRHILETRKEIRWHDQDILNLLFQDRFDNLPLTYNVSDMIVRRYPELTVLEDPVIVHFNGPVKPWQPSATSPHAREWRQRYSEAGFAADFGHPTSKGQGGVYQHSRRSGRGHLGSLLRAILPADTKRIAKVAATDLVDRTVCRLEDIRVGLHSPRFPENDVPAPRADTRPYRKTGRIGENADWGLDLLISVARSGTNALGEVIQRSRPDVRWMNELFLGAQWSSVVDEELADQFPWFANGGPDALNEVPPADRQRAFDSFAATVSGQAIDLTRAVLKDRSGRTLIKVFPEQLHPAAFNELLRTFRPRLLVLRRELVFTYISRLRAIQLDGQTRQFGKSWQGTDLTDAPYEIDDRAALQYALRCDSWFDQLDQLATELGLTNLWLTHTGLFTTGTEIPLLESFYPGPAMPIVAGSQGLQSGLTIQDRRSDASVLGMIKAVSKLSAATQSHLLRLPGRHVTCA